MNTTTASIRALRAKEAGEYLATILGLDKPIGQHQMWKYARLNYFPTVRLGHRRVLFRTDALDQFIATGGTDRFRGNGRRQQNTVAESNGVNGANQAITSPNTSQLTPNAMKA